MGLEFSDRFDGLVQERRNSSALAMELRLSCTSHRNDEQQSYQESYQI